MKDQFAAEVAQEGDDPEIAAILLEVCHASHMGFVAVARVTEEQVDRGAGPSTGSSSWMTPGEELDVKKTICDDIRECGQAIIIDRIADDPEWRTHPVPALYGFESYASIPNFLADGSFYMGTLARIRSRAAHAQRPGYDRTSGKPARSASRRILSAKRG